MDRTTLVIAIYGALLASLGFVWQVFTWWRSSGTRITVTVRGGIVGTPGVHADEVVLITAINDSGHEMRLDSAGVELQDGSGSKLFVTMPPNGATIPGLVAPHSSAKTWIEKADADRAGIDVFQPLRGFVYAANGKQYRSKPTTLMVL